ncbi:DUF3604 domain-containing protein [Egicoccus sp. AB-alg2]|uniref:DUF3604 domain-containing protein n=1 Tax=Egicoccus sp. AB-alg2 TaxID=3242693 RepID=UPI00359CEA15
MPPVNIGDVDRRRPVDPTISSPADRQPHPADPLRPQPGTAADAHDDAARRRALEEVRAFSRQLLAAAAAGTDLTTVNDRLDPDPARFFWIDEGDGTIPELLAAARQVLMEAPPLPGHVRHRTRRVPTGGAATRPSVAVGPDGRRVLAWISWRRGEGEHVVATVAEADGAPLAAPAPVSGPPTDVFRPRTVVDAAGRCWVAYARADGVAGPVAVYARVFDDGDWGDEQLVSTTAHPSFNQELIAHADGSVEVVWQGRDRDRFGIHTRRWRDGAWQETVRLDADVAGNAWDPSLTVAPDGDTVYAWCSYRGGAYGIVTRRAGAAGPAVDLGPARPLTGGTDYALHPSLATAGDGSVWCAFDLVTIHGHGGSGPTALLPTERLASPPTLGMRDAGRFVPPEMRPNTRARVHAVRLTDDGVEEDPVPLGRGFEVNPSGMPQLAATAGGGVVAVYRILRRLPLLHYYWEVAVQHLGPDGPGPVGTLSDSDGGMEEPAVAWSPDGAVVVAATDLRTTHALSWEHGFGGRRDAALSVHVGEVAWHGVHGDGEVVVADVPGGPPPRRGRTRPTVTASGREEARAWLAGPQERYRTEVEGVTRSLYWGDLHRHSLISRCTAADDPGIDDFYRYAWDVCDYDFWAVTDHAENSSDHQWWHIQKLADLFHVPDRFVPLYGFEWTSDHGHQNVIYGDVARGAPILSSTDEATDRPDTLWAALRQFPRYPAITIPHHPGAAMVHYDWSYGDESFLRLVEVFQSCRGNYEHDGCFRQYMDATLPGTFTVDGLRAGHRFGLVASSDHGYGASYVGVYATSLRRGDVFAALHDRRTIAATARGIVVDARIGDTFLGGERRQNGPVELQAYVRGYRDLARIDIVRDGELAHAITPRLDLPRGWVAAPLRVEWGGARTDRDWSGTLTIDGGEVLQTPYWARDIREVSRDRVRWQAATHAFGGGGWYAPTRGGVDLTVVGPPHAHVVVDTASGVVRATLRQVRNGVVHAAGVEAPPDGTLRLQPGTGGLTSLGDREHTLSWVDPAGGPAFYYVRVFLVDGEMAWSSPIWVDPG